MNLNFTVLLSLILTYAIPFARDGSITTGNAALQQKAAPRSLAEIHALIQTAAQKHRVPAEFVKSIVAAESGFNSEAVSSKGAIGLMQLMPETAHEWGGDPAIVEQNIDAGTRYLGFLLERYRKSRRPMAYAIAAYNAGPGAVDRFHGVPPYRETRGYVTRVLTFLRHFQRQSRQEARAGVLEARADTTGLDR